MDESIKNYVCPACDQDSPYSNDECDECRGINPTHHTPDHSAKENCFKCRQCGEKYPDCFGSTEDIGMCRWCSGEEGPSDI